MQHAAQALDASDWPVEASTLFARDRRPAPSIGRPDAGAVKWFGRFLLRLLRLMVRSRTHLAAENLFLRKQLACYIERQVWPHRTDDASRITLVLLSRFVAWRELLTTVRPDTLVRWHRDLFRLFWRVKSRRRGRPRIPIDVQRLIADMGTHNHTWGEGTHRGGAPPEAWSDSVVAHGATLYAIRAP